MTKIDSSYKNEEDAQRSQFSLLCVCVCMCINKKSSLHSRRQSENEEEEDYTILFHH